MGNDNFASLRMAIAAVSDLDNSAGIGPDTYVIEECSELIKELTKKQRGKGSDSAIIAEACDVLTTVMLLLYDLGVPEEQAIANILFKCRCAVERFNENNEM